MHTSRTSCEDEGREQGDVAEAKECQRLTENTKKLGERHGTFSSSQSPEEIEIP